MFDVLVESNRKGRRDLSGTVGGMFMSTVFQSLVLVGAVYATMEVAAEQQELDMDTIVLMLDEPEAEPEEPDEHQHNGIHVQFLLFGRNLHRRPEPAPERHHIQRASSTRNRRRWRLDDRMTRRNHAVMDL